MTHHTFPFDVTHALEDLPVPAGVVDREGRVRWQNRGAVELFGDRVGEPFLHAVAQEDAHLARAQFAKKMIGEARATDYVVTMLARDGRRVRCRVSAATLRQGGEVLGMLALAYPAEPLRESPAGRPPELTARQHEVLGLLAEGLGTGEIAERLGVAEETARNHIRALLRQLDAHSRLEAVVSGYRLGLIRPHLDD